MPWTALAQAAALSAAAVLLSGCVYVYVDRGGYYYRPLPASPPAAYDGGGYSPSPQPWTAPPPTPSPTFRATRA